MATMKEVAKAANVSIATVSNIINGKFTTRNDTYFRVQQAIQDLNYHPNFSARNLRANKTRLIGVILPKMNVFYSEIYDGILSVFKDSNIFPILKTHSDDPILESNIIDEFMNVGVAGIIVVPSDPERLEKKYKDVQYQQIPVILMERDISAISCDKFFFENEKLLYETIEAWKESPEEVILVRLDMNYSCEGEIEHGFRKKYPGGQIVRVSSHKDHMFGELLMLFAEKGQTLKKLIATNIDIANSAADASAMMGCQVEIYALTGNSWKICDDNGSIHRIPRNGFRGGFLTAERMEACLGEGEYYADQIFRIEPVFVPEKHMIDQDTVRGAGTIRILALECEAVSALEILSLELTKRYGCKFEFDKKNYGELNASVERAMQGECEYDILMIDKPWMKRCFNNRVLQNLGNEFGADIFRTYPEFVTKIMFENRFRPYCIPFVTGVQAIHYRADLFRNKEIRDMFWKRYETEMDIPKNWTEYNRLAEFFTNFHYGDSLFSYGTMIGSADIIGLVGEFLPRQWSFNGSVLDSRGKPALNTPANERALASLCETFRYSDPIQLGKVRDEEIFSSLLAGKIPMAIGFTNHYHPTTEKDAEYANLIRTTPLPRNRAMVGGYLLGISSNSDKFEVCREFLKMVMSDQWSVACMRMQGFIPTNAVYKNDYLTRINPWLSLMEKCSGNRCTREVLRDHMGEDITDAEMDLLVSEMIMKAFRGESLRDLLEDTNNKLQDRVYLK